MLLVKQLECLTKLNVPMLGVVENMSYFECSKCNEKHYIFGNGGAEKISEKHNMPLLGAIPLNSGIMEGSELGKPVMITQPDSPSAKAFTVAAKNIAAQCSIQHYKQKEEAEAEAKWDGLSPEERKKILVVIIDSMVTLGGNILPEDENKTWAELERAIQVAIYATTYLENPRYRQLHQLVRFSCNYQKIFGLNLKLRWEI